jgi:hypothetical protein
LFRTAIASCFADSVALPELRKLHRLEITHSPGHRMTGLLLAAWLGVRLDCTLETANGQFRLIQPSGLPIQVSLDQVAGAEALQRVVLRSEGGMFTVSRECGATRVCTKVIIGGNQHETMLPADLVTDSALVSEQLSRLGGQSLYHKILPMLLGMMKKA